MAVSPSHRFGQIIGDFLEAVIEPFADRLRNAKVCSISTTRTTLERREKARRLPGKTLTAMFMISTMFSNEMELTNQRGRPSLSLKSLGDGIPSTPATKRRRFKGQFSLWPKSINGPVQELPWRCTGGCFHGGLFGPASVPLASTFCIFPMTHWLPLSHRKVSISLLTETTQDVDFHQYIKTIESATESKMERIKDQLIRANQRQLDEFMSSIAQRLERIIEKVVVIPLYGRSSEFGTIADAIKFLDQHRIYEGSGEFRRYEVLVTFTNGDRV